MQGKIDTTLPVRLGWSSDLKLVPAGPFLRAFALLIDHFLMLFLISFLTVIGTLSIALTSMETMQGIVLFLFFVGLFVVYNGYFFLSEWLLKGQSPGKLVCGLRVVQIDGSQPGVWSLLIRNLLRIGDMFPYLTGYWVFMIPSYTVAAFTSSFSNHFRRLGDFAAGTVVVYERVPFLRLSLIQNRKLSTATQLYPVSYIDPSLYEAVTLYMARRYQLSTERRNEIVSEFHNDLKALFSWTGKEPSAEELVELIYEYSQNSQTNLSKS